MSSFVFAYAEKRIKTMSDIAFLGYDGKEIRMQLC